MPSATAIALPPPAADARARRRFWLVAGGLAVALLAGLAIGFGQSHRVAPRHPLAPASDPSAPGALSAPVPAPAGDDEATQLERMRDHQERWLRIQDELAQGMQREAVEDLANLLEAYPDDEQARAVLDQLLGRGGPRGPGRGKKHRE